jgi:hypothetical protein
VPYIFLALPNPFIAHTPKEPLMKLSFTLGALVLLASTALFAKDRPSYDQGVLLSMQSTTCGAAENDGKTVAGEILGSDSSHKKTQEVLCQEYILQGDHITYRIRPKDDKHPLLLPIGQAIQFRIHKDKMYLRDPEGDQKEHEYTVVSMEMRQDVKDVETPNRARSL